MVLSYIYMYVMHFPIKLCGRVDSVENYQSIFYFMLCGNGVRALYYGIFFVCFVTHISISHDFHAQPCFHHVSFSLRILLMAVEMSDRQAFRSQARQIAVTDPI